MCQVTLTVVAFSLFELQKEEEGEGKEREGRKEKEKRKNVFNLRILSQS